MNSSSNEWRMVRMLLAGLGLLVSVGLTGCQIESGGQTLPSPYYQKDDVQYFPPGAEFKLSKEAAAMKAYNQDQAQKTTAPAPQR
jgi:hypothetical protein